MVALPSSSKADGPETSQHGVVNQCVECRWGIVRELDFTKVGFLLNENRE